ncbi:HNH endonuclease [Cronobacter phage CR3]|uniref:Putative HNH endonuclease 2 n=1 Tax=Cronobacter phage CR3 TaxID=1162295 RepID=I1TRV4_9CAUD|nr:HNH endonuclease [Cronobacter phage CR3]AFH21427.1 putative HNH endonuclease 2 [Cronobacter phage CR3]
MTEKIMKSCSIHGETEHFVYKTRTRCSKCNTEAVARFRRNIKEKAIDYKGGECNVCGYNKCHAALEFHHLDPNEKDFAIGGSGLTRPFKDIKKELDKCVMLCSNCHREVHAGLIELNQ